MSKFRLIKTFTNEILKKLEYEINRYITDNEMVTDSIVIRNSGSGVWYGYIIYWEER